MAPWRPRTGSRPAPRTAARLVAAIDRLGGSAPGNAGPASSGPASSALVRHLAGLLRAAVPAEGLLLLRTDPTTVLPTHGVVEALPPGPCQPFWDNELLEPDVNKFAALAQGPLAGTLRQATGGELGRSHRYRTLYRELRVTDELRVSFAARDGFCWGVAQLIRTSGAFTPAERELLAGVAPAVAAALRSRFAAAWAPPATGPALSGPVAEVSAGPALVVLDRAGEITAITPEARRWLAELAEGSRTGMVPVPEPVYTVAARARAARAGRGDGPACVQVRTAGRGWLHLHASCLDPPGGGSTDGAVAVVLTPAQPSDLLPLLALGYRLTHREQQVLSFLARGMTTTAMTDRLGISPHTVRDHIKALFGKVGVRSRAELVARIFAEHYVERLDAVVERR